MAKTELGCQVLNRKGHFGEFAQFIKTHGLEQEDPDIILKLKSILWAVVKHVYVRSPSMVLIPIYYPRVTLGPLRVVCLF